MREHKFTIAYYLIVVFPGLIMELIHFYLCMFSSYIFVAKDGLIITICIVLSIPGGFIFLAEQWNEL